MESSELSTLDEIRQFLVSKWGDLKPRLSIICGSGWGEIVDALPSVRALSYQEIPGMSDTTVEGHAGKLILSEFENFQILVFQGRRHYYEGAGWGPIRLPVFLSHHLGTGDLLLTNAAGGISKEFQVGDLMVLDDHINLMPDNPLKGTIPHPSIPRFPDQSQVYNLDLKQRVLEIGQSQGLKVQRGVYLGLSGPAFETPAEIRAFSKLGADAVGMSTVPEAMLGNALGMKVVALSCISNLAAGISNYKLSHEDVAEASKQALPQMKSLVLQFISKYELKKN